LIGCSSSIFAIERFQNLHALGYFTKCGEARSIQPGVIGVINENLGGACIRSRGGKGNRTFSITGGGSDRIVIDASLTPKSAVGRIAVDPELNHEVRQYSEKSAVVIKSMLYQIVKPVGADGRQRTGRFDHEISFGGFKFCKIGLGRLFSHFFAMWR
jgi:hypothetical protein